METFAIEADAGYVCIIPVTSVVIALGLCISVDTYTMSSMYVGMLHNELRGQSICRCMVVWHKSADGSPTRVFGSPLEMEDDCQTRNRKTLKSLLSCCCNFYQQRAVSWLLPKELFREEVFHDIMQRASQANAIIDID